mmetsp:Transcript_5203/g.16395  ORF Transcript_5203/g.16395 Transcript_5203/m.16395 type:complete len:162 (+) Transcript_5203:232-717(+)
MTPLLRRSPLAAWQALVDKGVLTHDAAQVPVVKAFDRLYASVTAEEEKRQPRGLYVYGAVGTGKSRIFSNFLFIVPLPPPRCCLKASCPCASSSASMSLLLRLQGSRRSRTCFTSASHRGDGAGGCTSTSCCRRCTRGRRSPVSARRSRAKRACSVWTNSK